MTAIFITVLVVAIVLTGSLALILLSYKQDKKERNLLAGYYEVAAAFQFFISKQEEIVTG